MCRGIHMHKCLFMSLSAFFYFFFSHKNSYYTGKVMYKLGFFLQGMVLKFVSVQQL